MVTGQVIVGHWAMLDLLKIEINYTLLPLSKYVTWPWPLNAITSSQSSIELTVYGNNIPGSMPGVSYNAPQIRGQILCHVTNQESVIGCCNGTTAHSADDAVVATATTVSLVHTHCITVTPQQHSTHWAKNAEVMLQCVSDTI